MIVIGGHSLKAISLRQSPSEGSEKQRGSARSAAEVQSSGSDHNSVGRFRSIFIPYGLSCPAFRIGSAHIITCYTGVSPI